MDSIVVRGGNKLQGEIKISGAKNAALPILAASLLSEDKIVLENVPHLIDIETMRELLNNHGAHVEWVDNNKLNIQAENIHNKVAPYDIVRKMRASIWVLGPLLVRFGHAEVSLPGGCAIGARMVDLHISVMEKFGAEIITKNGYIIANAKNGLTGTHYNFAKISVGATINALFVAVLAKGESVLTNCAYEPEIVDVCHFLQKMGAKITGVGTSTLIIEGVERLHGTTHHIIGDRIEAGTYMMALGLTGGELKLSGIDPHIIENIMIKLEETGMAFETSDNAIKIKSNSIIKARDVQTEAFPGFATDLQAQYMSLMTIAEGTSVISENIFENRFMHVPELNRMGANIIIDGHTAIVRGVEALSGAEVMASDLRASGSLIIAGLQAQGVTKVRRVYHLDRGYERLEQKLQACGADIVRITGDKA